MHGSTGGGWKRSDWSGSSKRDNPMGNRGHQGFGTYHQMITTAPAPDPTMIRLAQLSGSKYLTSYARSRSRAGGWSQATQIWRRHPADAGSTRLWQRGPR